MRRPLAVLVVATAALASAQSAFGATGGNVTAVEIPLHGARALAETARTTRFTLVGVHWRGPGGVSFRTHAVGGRWSSWRPAAPEDDAPDSDSPEARARPGWHIGSPWWVGVCDRLEIRTSGRVARARAYLVWSPVVEVPLRTPAATQRPPIVPRLSWGADESIRRAPPRYAPSLRFAIVHHTAGRNGYTRAEAPAIVKGIQLYHVKGNGWNDIGYNFLVDRFGTIYEGRFGGVDRNVVGAHALGFNTGSVGAAVLGTYGSAPPSGAAQDGVAKLLAWRLDLAHVDPASMLTVVSGGSERYASGMPVTLRAVSGHRDTGLTECPGDAFYRRLDAIAAAAREIGGPKIFGPRVEVAKSGQVHFRAALSTSLQWAVSIADGDGNVVGGGSGTGTSVDWTWDAAAPAARYRWEISAGAARPATGSLRAGVGSSTLAIQGLAATPGLISPNGDGQADTSLVGFTLTAPAFVSVNVFDGAENLVLPVLADQRLLAGKQTVLVDGSTLADGTYSVDVRARGDTGTEVESVVPLTVSRLLGLVTAAPPIFSPNGDGRRDRLDVEYDLTAAADVRIRVLRDGTWVATPLLASLEPGHQSFVWGGNRASGRIRDGVYELVVEATNEAGSGSFSVPFTVDSTAPIVRVVSLRPLQLSVSEPAVLKLRVDGVPLQRGVKHAGTVRIRLERPLRRLRAVAWDAAGNASVPLLAVRQIAKKPRK
jgi:hypothetical protein